MTLQIVYPELRIGASPIAVEFLQQEQACSLAGSILELIVNSYGAQFEGGSNPLPHGTFAAKYDTNEAVERFSQKVIPGVYERGGGYAVIREPSGQTLMSSLKILPGEQVEERFAGMLGIAEILTAPRHQGKGLGTAILHAYLKFAAPQYEGARLMLDAFIDSPVNTWYQAMGFAYEEPSGSLELGPELALPTQYMVSQENISVSGLTKYLETKRPVLQKRRFFTKHMGPGHIK